MHIVFGINRQWGRAFYKQLHTATPVFLGHWTPSRQYMFSLTEDGDAPETVLVASAPGGGYDVLQAGGWQVYSESAGRQSEGVLVTCDDCPRTRRHGAGEPQLGTAHCSKKGMCLEPGGRCVCETPAAHGVVTRAGPVCQFHAPCSVMDVHGAVDPEQGLVFGPRFQIVRDEELEGQPQLLNSMAVWWSFRGSEKGGLDLLWDSKGRGRWLIGSFPTWPTSDPAALRGAIRTWTAEEELAVLRAQTRLQSPATQLPDPSHLTASGSVAMAVWTRVACGAGLRPQWVSLLVHSRLRPPQPAPRPCLRGHSGVRFARPSGGARRRSQRARPPAWKPRLGRA